MPDWRAMVRARLAGCGLRPTTEMDVVEELSQHVEDRFQQFCADGMSEDEARSRSLCEIDGEDLVTDLMDVLPREEA